MYEGGKNKRQPYFMNSKEHLDGNKDEIFARKKKVCIFAPR